MRINSKEELLNKKAQIEQKLKDFTCRVLVCSGTGCMDAAAAVCGDTPPDLILHNEHTELLHLLAQFLDIIADDAVVDVYIGIPIGSPGFGNCKI